MFVGEAAEGLWVVFAVFAEVGADAVDRDGTRDGLVLGAFWAAALHQPESFG